LASSEGIERRTHAEQAVVDDLEEIAARNKGQPSGASA
jgi:hypothetical protein